MKNEVAIPLPTADHPLTLFKNTQAITRKQPARKLINGICGIIAEVAFAVALTLIGFLISIIFIG
jgi:hypothetical protein